jgi:AraC family transcriptional regulator
VSQHIPSNSEVTLTRFAEKAQRTLQCVNEGERPSVGRAISLLQELACYRPMNTPLHIPGLPLSWARKVTAHIDSNISMTIRVQDLARMTGFSMSYFQHAFTSCFGMPPHRYIILRRIQVAQQLMLQTGEPLSQISLTCGMADQAHFSRTFRRFVGESPHRWRAARRDLSAQVSR